MEDVYGLVYDDGRVQFVIAEWCSRRLEKVLMDIAERVLVRVWFWHSGMGWNRC